MPNVDVDVKIPDIDGWIGVLNGYAQDASSNANSLANSLAKFQGTSYAPEVTFKHYDPTVVLQKPDGIDPPIFEIKDRTPPSALAISIPNVDLGLGDIPELDAISPDVIMPPVPSELDATAPEKTFTLDLDKDFPLSPDTTLPTPPTLVSLDLPDDISVLNPLFEGVIPDSANIDVPGITFNFSEDPYSSSLLDDINTELLLRLSSSTGINPVVEQAIWDRGRDREHTATLDADRGVVEDKSSQGFTRPTGALMSALDRSLQESRGKVIELSREVMIKQAELEQENFKFSMQQAITLESTLINQYNNVQQRSFEVAKYLQEVSFEVFKLLVAKYNTELEAYKASSQVFEAEVKAELIKVEIFKAQIDAEKVKGEINDQNIRVYVAQIEAINSTVEIYKTQVQAVSEELRAEGLKVETYKSDVEAYATLVGAKSDEYRSYSERVKAEMSRVDIYDSQVKAYTSRIQAYSIGKDTEIKQASLKMDIEDLKIKKYLADIEAFIKQVQADQLTYQSSVDVYKGQLQNYMADIGFSTAQSEIGLKAADTIIDQNKYDVSTAIERIKIRANIIADKNNNQLEGLKAAGATYAQLASSSLNAVSVSASAGGSASGSISETWTHALTS